MSIYNELWGKEKFFPRYNKRGNFNTNAESYYKYLERVNEVLKIMAKKIDEYDGTVQEYLSQWEKNLEDFPDDVKDLLEEWVVDGTLEHIINHEIFNDKLDKSIFEQFELSTNQHLTQNEEYRNDFAYNVKSFGAKGDGETDDTNAIQNALDTLYNQGGGALLFPLGTYLITKPLLIKSVADHGGYDFAPIRIMGEGNRDSTIVKRGAETLYNIDATGILIKGSTLNINDSWSGFHFENIRLRNESTALLTYGLYGNSGSRLMANYSCFETIRDINNIENHDRYGIYIRAGWTWNFKDCMFNGDYGFYNEGNSTSLILENTFVGADKIGYHITGGYSTLINPCGDYCNGTMFKFNFATLHVTSLAGESPNCHTMLDLNNSNVTIDNAFFFQSKLETGTVIMGNASTLRIKTLTVQMQDTSIGYLWRGGIQFDLTIEKLRLNGTGKFTKDDFSTMNGNRLTARVTPHKRPTVTGVETLLDYNGYWDWYMEEPTYKMNNIYMGLKAPTVDSTGTTKDWGNAGEEDGIYFNSDFSERNVLGWVRHSQTGTALISGKNYYIPLIVAGTTSERPTNPVVGMSYYDASIGKPIWYTGAVWKDATGTTV